MISDTISYSGKLKRVIDFVSSVPKGHYVSCLISARLLLYDNYHVTFYYKVISGADITHILYMYKYLVRAQSGSLLNIVTTNVARFKSKEHPEANIWEVKFSNLKIQWYLIYQRFMGWQWRPHITDYDNKLRQQQILYGRLDLSFAYHPYEFNYITTLEVDRFMRVLESLNDKGVNI